MAKSVNILIAAKDHASSAFAKAGAAAGGFGSRMMSLKGLLAGALGGFALKATLEKAVSAWGLQEQAQAKLAATLRATGGAAGFTAEQLQKYAGNLQKITIFGDEATINGMALLATFKEIKGDTFERTTRAMLDMTAAMGGEDLKGAAIQLGKALNDPVKGLTALSRVGVSFSDVQRQQIQQFAAAGEIAKAQAVILDELEGEFGGVAQAMAQTSTGAMQQFKNAVGDVWESIGQGLAPTLKGLTGHLQELLPYFHTAAQWLGEHLTAAFSVAEWAAQNWKLVLDQAIIGASLGVVGFYEDVKHFFTEAIPTYLDWFGRNWKEVFIDALNAVGYAFENFGKNVWTIMGEVWEYITSWGASGFEEGWSNSLKGLLDGFTSVIQEDFPTVAERGLTDLEKFWTSELARVTNQMGPSLAEALAARTGELTKTPALTVGGMAGATAAGGAATATAQSQALRATEARFLGRSPADDAARRAADQTQRNTATMVKLLARNIDLAERQLQATEKQTQAVNQEEEVDI